MRLPNSQVGLGALPGPPSAKEIGDVLKILEEMEETSVRIFLGREAGRAGKGTSRSM